MTGLQYWIYHIGVASFEITDFSTYPYLVLYLNICHLLKVSMSIGKVNPIKISTLS